MNTFARVSALAALTMALAVSASATPILIPRDTVIPVTMDKALGSATGRAGNTFYVHQDGTNGEGFPNNTRFTGKVVSVTKASGTTAGQIGVSFVKAKMPNGRTVAIVGRLTSLDDASTKTDPDTGRLVGKSTGNKNSLKFTAYGAGAGLVIGEVVKKKALLGSIIGAAAGYLYGRSQDKAAVGKNVQVAAGTRFGIILDQDVVVPGSTSIASAASTEPGQDSSSGQQVVYNDLQPVMSGNGLMVPFRSTMDSLNMPFNYNSATQNIRMTNNSQQQVHYDVGSRYVYVDGKATRMNTASRMINGSLYVPASYIELMTSKTADWNQQSEVLSLN